MVQPKEERFYDIISLSSYQKAVIFSLTNFYVMTQHSENIFYGKDQLLTLSEAIAGQGLTKAGYMSILDKTWNEAKSTKEGREMFHVLLFQCGQIPNRHNNVFGKATKDNGGHGNRVLWEYTLEWLILFNPNQYYEFLSRDLFRQFVGLSEIFSNRVQTTKGSTHIVRVIDPISKQNLIEHAKYHANLIKSTTAKAELSLIAKSLIRIKYHRDKYVKGTRIKKGYRQVGTDKHRMNKLLEQYYIALSREMSWEVIEYDTHVDFKGLYAWKKEAGATNEATLFSSGNILKFTKPQFIDWVDKLSAMARRRVHNRLIAKGGVSKGKWITPVGEDMATWYNEWEGQKVQAVTQEKKLIEKKRVGTITASEEKNLIKLERQTKVGTAGEDFISIMEKLQESPSDYNNIEIIAHNLMKLLTINVKGMVCVDVSASMGMGRVVGSSFAPRELARILATLILWKLPETKYNSIMATFGTRGTVYADASQGISAANKFMTGITTNVPKLIDRTKSFAENVKGITELTGESHGGTNLSSLHEAFHTWVMGAANGEEKIIRKETILEYPLLIVLSDGHFNSSYNPTASVSDFMHNMKASFGWRGGLVIIDLDNNGRSKDEKKFKGIENVFHMHGWNMGEIEKLLKYLKDGQLSDVYSDLMSTYKSDRYELVRKHTL